MSKKLIKDSFYSPLREQSSNKTVKFMGENVQIHVCIFASIDSPFSKA